METIMALGFTAFFFVGIVLIMKWSKRKADEQNAQKPAYQRHNGVFLHGQASGAHKEDFNLYRRLINHVLYVYVESLSRYVRLGYISSGQGSQITIALYGEWEKVDEHTIRGMVDFFIDEGGTSSYKSRSGNDVTYPIWWGGPVECELKIGDVFLVGHKVGRRASSGKIVPNIAHGNQLTFKITHF